MNMNVLTNIQKYFPTAIKCIGQVERYPTFKAFLAEYKQLMAAPIEAKYTRLLDIFKVPNKHLAVATAYIEKTWLSPWRKKLVAC